MARIAIISPSPASRAWRGRFGPQSPSIRAPRARCPPPRVRLAADLVFAGELGMPVYTVHGPSSYGADISATDKFTFVRDGFHVAAMVFGPLWLIWKRLWLATIGWIVVTVALQVALRAVGAGSAAIAAADFLVAVLLGLEAASVQRWTLSRGNWRQLDIVLAGGQGA